ncbi:MAG: CusA/CzcA family heavy metal efflux RND transporter [Spartobacteria bacterium]
MNSSPPTIESPPPARRSFVERIIAWCALNRFLVLVGLFFAIVVGIYAVRNIPLDAIPDLSDVQVIVFTEWPGRAPTIVEDQVSYPIVSTLAAAPKVKYARGQSFFGLSFVSVIFEDGTDIYWARSRVLEYLNQVRNQLPENVNPVLGPDATGVGWVYEYALVDDTGKHSLAELRSFQDWTLRYYLQNTPGVAEVASLGGYVNQYQVDIDPNKLLAFHIPINKVIEAIRESNNDVGGRVIEFGETEYMVRGEGYIKNLADIEKVVVGLGENGVPITVKDVGRVHRGPEIRRGLLDLDGKGEAVGGIVVMRYGENALKTIEAVKKKLEEFKPSLPPGVRIVTGYDRSDLIHRAIATLREKLVEESIIVSLICLLFLFHFRSALVAILTLPVAILLAFIPMHALGLSSNIMSLSGIAIAIGAMVDAAIVMVENAHKWLERWEHAHARREQEGAGALSTEEREVVDLSRTRVIIKAAQQVGRPLFFSLLIITVSFVPVFSLQAQSGRLFKPLAYTKTFAMFFAALLSVTLVPILMVWFIRGKIPDENRNPINRFLVWIYQPLVSLVLHYRWTSLIIAAVLLALTWIPHRRIGSEFMPPLNEGTLLYMPTAVPGIAISEAKEILQKQDAIIAQFPEVEHVYGKVGRARTATDPAPLSMIETVITLKPEEQWRAGMTFDRIKQELTARLPFPGMPAIWWMPIQTRIEMMATGIRSQIGIKVLGTDLAKIEEIATAIEGLLKNAPHTASAFAERVTGGYYVDFKINRDAIARYGLRVADVEEVIESAIGGKNISTTVEGRERFPINVRYARDFRSDLPALRRVLVATPGGAQIPLEQLAEIGLSTGPPSIRDENGVLAGFVFVDTVGIDLGTYVENAKKLISDHIKLPPGYYIQWGGQYQYLLKARENLRIAIPITLLIIFLLLYLNFRNVTESLIVMLSVPFALVGGVWLLYLLGYNYSVAVAVGFIALAGVAAETGVVMIVYLDEAWDNLKKKTARPKSGDLYDAVMFGAVQRVRPKMMTVCAIIAGLLPIMWSHGTGADTMKRIAAPMVGGMISSTILTLLIIPALYFLWRRRELSDTNEEEAVPLLPRSRETRRRLFKWIALIIGLIAIFIGGSFVWHKARPAEISVAPFFTQTVNGLTVNFIEREGRLHEGNNELLIECRDSKGQLVDVGQVKFDLDMSMPGMHMHSGATIEQTTTPGRYLARLKIDMAGDWNAKISFDGPRGKGEANFPLNAH